MWRHCKRNAGESNIVVRYSVRLQCENIIYSLSAESVRLTTTNALILMTPFLRFGTSWFSLSCRSCEGSSVVIAGDIRRENVTHLCAVSFRTRITWWRSTSRATSWSEPWSTLVIVLFCRVRLWLRVDSESCSWYWAWRFFDFSLSC